MKLRRLIAYGAAGIIAGLLFENKALIYKGKAKNTAGKLKRKIRKTL